MNSDDKNASGEFGWFETLLLAGMAVGFAIGLLVYEIGRGVGALCHAIRRAIR